MKNYLIEFFSNEKDKEVIKNIFFAFIIKGAALLIAFFSLPAFIRFFDNQDVLGVWFTILSVLTWILSFDFGIGNGLRNNLVGAVVRNNKTEIKEYISSAYIIIGGIVILGISIGITVFPFINWNSIFNISESLVSPRTMFFAVIIVFITIMLQFFLRLISFILYALQQSAVNNFLALITSATLLFFVLIFPSVDTQTNLKVLSLAYLLCVNVPLFFATIIFSETGRRRAGVRLLF
jgi:O-antigen/teichoic acid export membrane protein